MWFLACCMLVEYVLGSGVPVPPSRWGHRLSILAFFDAGYHPMSNSVSCWVPSFLNSLGIGVMTAGWM